MLRQMSRGHLPQNHPYIPYIADKLKTTEGKIRLFAHGRSLGPVEVERLVTRLDNYLHPERKNGTHPMKQSKDTMPIGQRDSTLARDREMAVQTKNPIMLARVDRGLTRNMLTEVSGVSSGSLGRIESGNMAPNSPVLAEVAPHYGLTLEQIAKFQKAPLMDEKVVEVHRKRLATLRAQGGLKAVRARNGNGKGHSPRETHTNGRHAGDDSGMGRIPKHLLKRRKMDVEQRENLRTLTNTVNSNAMNGITETTVPTQMLSEFLRAYYAAIGVESNVVLDFVFDRLFD